MEPKDRPSKRYVAEPLYFPGYGDGDQSKAKEKASKGFEVSQARSSENSRWKITLTLIALGFLLIIAGLIIAGEMHLILSE